MLRETCRGLWRSSYHEAQVESLSTVSKVPETLQPRSREHHGEVVLVGAPEQLLVRDVGVGVRLGPAVNRTPKHQDEEKQAGNPKEHVWEHGELFSKWKGVSGVCGEIRNH